MSSRSDKVYRGPWPGSRTSAALAVPEYGDGDGGDDEDYTLTVQLSPSAYEIVCQLLETGLYGDSDEEVAEQLVYERLKQIQQML